MLTNYEKRLLIAYGKHGSQKLAAYEMGLSLQSFRNALSHIYLKLSADNYITAVINLGWLVLPLIQEEKSESFEN